MDRARVKVLLAAYRAGSDDASDPIFREVLDLLAQDPELAEWFRAEQEFDAAMVGKFREVPVDDSGAKERIRNAVQRAADGDSKE